MPHSSQDPAASSAMHPADNPQNSDPSSITNRSADFQNTATQLTTISDANSDGNAMAVGLEMESLAAIFSDECLRLHVTGRPSSYIESHPTAHQDLTASGTATPSAVSATRKALVEDGLNLDNIDVAMNRLSTNLDHSGGQRLRYEVTLPLWQQDDAEWVAVGSDANQGSRLLASKETAIPTLRILVSLPESYPESSPPQLQLLGRYLGQYKIDTTLFGDVTRAFISQNGIPFSPGDVCVFEGVEYVRDTARTWYLGCLREDREASCVREQDRHHGNAADGVTQTSEYGDISLSEDVASPTTQFFSNHAGPTKTDLTTREDLYSSASRAQAASRLPMESPNPLEFLPPHIVVHTAAPITVSRSVFQGHACRVTDVREVPLVIHQLLSDKKIAKASHPVIHAYRIVKQADGEKSGPILLSDNDDDGETAAGGRLAHLLQILELEDVLVVVSRWYGGVLLGPERFKLINQAARDALDLGGFLPSSQAGLEWVVDRPGSPAPKKRARL